MAASLRFYFTVCSLVFAATLFGSARSWWWSHDEKPPAVPSPKPETTTVPTATQPTTTKQPEKPKDHKAIEEANKLKERKQNFPARRRQMGIDSKKFHIVMAGYAGAGKSSAVNAFIGKKSGEKGSAPEGNSGETTAQPRLYENVKLHPNISGKTGYQFVWFSVRVS